VFDTVLVANRGEIARRVIRTLRRLGIASIAVHTEADRGAPHVREATVALPISSYLDVEAILAAATSAPDPAEAIHPGYGFLSENPALSAACADAGIAFVGPPAAAVALMGDKLAAKALAERAGVPTVPTFTEAQARDAPADAFPLLVKAAAGGGGRGMRVVARPGELDAALAAARREALAGFGDERVFIERFVPRARHLEVQVLADGYGTVVHLGERECSLQRRHQKVIEESPSPAVSPELRERLGAEAVALAAAAGYVNAGTVEFIADAADPARHWFLEMNARLQVEHPVTEAVTGLDLVELQLRVAAGEPLGVTQDEIRLDGHAIEARITAEDPARGFLPTAGRVLAYERPTPLPPRPPTPGPPSPRVDDAIEVGSTVDTAYDSLLAKLIVHATDRSAAVRHLQRALAETTILGLTTSTGYLRALVDRPEFVAGDLDTGLVERLGALPGPLDDTGVATCAGMLLVADADADAATGGDPFARADGWRLGGTRAASVWRLSVDGRPPVQVEVPAAWAALAHRTAPGRFAIDGRGEWRLARDGDTVWIGHAGHAWAVRPASAARDAGAGGDGRVRAPMPGQVLLVPVGVGDAVRAGDPLVVLESMKMELTLAAPVSGVVAELSVTVGDRVVVEQPLARVEPEPDPRPDPGPDPAEVP
jgi:acetyl-CoA/propionyl-CoA carboxylase, biotin carboxylase, biotin carboxyl carrier protein